jgi:hypothetical protein
MGPEPHFASGLLQHQANDLVDEHEDLASRLKIAGQFGEWIDNVAGS